ncbi:MAG: OmcA/MtrC family decaheme c-type cytochrome [Geothrix sp.]|nr:OmcA/MtrC family decaheme c-type cytochrome [Geothrix sp.]
MKHRPLKQLYGLLATAAIALVLIGCNGSAGQSGTNGTNGTNGTDGTNATNVVDAALLTPVQWTALKPTGTITAVTVPATGAGTPVVDFRLVDPAGNGIKGLGGFTSKSATATLFSYPNLAFALAKLVPEDAATKAPSKWVSYIVNTIPTTTAVALPGRPTSDNTGTLVDNGDGTYKYTFYRDIKAMQAFLDAYTPYTAPNSRADLGDVTYVPTLPHRLTIQFSGNARGTGSNTPDGVTVATAVPMGNPINMVYDFVPGTGLPLAAGADKRDVVDINKCNECHKDFFKTSPHSGRVETRYCAVCHSDQRKYGRAVATAGTTTTYSGTTYKFNMDSAATQTTAAGDFPAMVHRIHMGTGLTKTGYNYAGILFEKIGYSMLDGGSRMCVKCHSNVPQADNWKTKPTRLACGTCHDSVDFSTGHGAGVGSLINDSQCASCHLPADITTYHMTPNLTPHNPAVAAGLANFTYEVTSATQATSGGPVTIKFRIRNNGTAVTFSPAAAGLTAPLTGFTGSPSFLLAWAMAQDGVAAPSDYNNLLTANGAPSASNFQPRSVSIAALLDTNKALTDGTLSAPDAAGIYTATVVGPTRIFPAGATLRSVGLQGYFTQVAGTWDSNGDGAITTLDTLAGARHAVSVMAYVDNSTASPRRRTAIDSAKCASCHEWFEGHGGNRVYEVQLCVQCHLPGLTTSGKGASNTQISNYYPSFTINDKDSLTRWSGVDFNTSNPVAAYAAANPASPDIALTFPQTTNNFKDMIHGIHAGKDRTTPIRIVRNRNTVQVVVDGGRIGFPGILNNCASCHTYNGYNVPTTGTLLATREEAINAAGNTTAALVTAALATANATDLMITPFTAACVTCHDSTAARAHMTLNGGQIKVNRSALNTAGEACAVCHGIGSTYDPVVIHK